MLKDGTYAAWFKTPLGEGTGIAHVLEGKIWGRDGVMTYSGTCEVDGDRFSATVVTKKHTDGRPTVFGTSEELTLTLNGTCPGKFATYVGAAKQVPGLVLEGTLILSEPTVAVPALQSPNRLVPARLPKLPNGRRGR